MEIEGWFKDGNPMIGIKLHGSEKPINVLVDSGFNGELMLTKENIKKLALTNIGDDEFITASGDVIQTTVYMSLIKWFGTTRKIAVLSTSGNTNLIGMELLHFYKLEIARSQNQLVISRI